MNLGQINAPMKVRHELPPIPLRDYDWCAYRDGYEENGDYGWGKTEQLAIDDLLAREAEALEDQ